MINYNKLSFVYQGIKSAIYFGNFLKVKKLGAFRYNLKDRLRKI
jgi:hypothetical protein